MLRRYDFYGGIRRPPTPPYPSMRFGQYATMAISPTPTPCYRPPPFVDNIRGWDDFFLNSPRWTPSDRCDFGSDFLVPPESHRQNQPALASTPKIFFFCESLPSFLASSRETLETSLFIPHAPQISTYMEMKQPSLSLTNATTIAERERYTATSLDGATVY